MQVSYGIDQVELDTEGAVEVQAIQCRLKSFMGIPHDAVARVDGVEIPPACLVQPDSTVEFVVKVGHKGIGRVFTQKEYCQLFGLTEADLEKQIEQGLRVMQTANGAVVTETAVDNFIAGLNGGGDGAFLALIANSLKRLADHVDPPQEQQSRAGDRYQAQLPQPKRKSPYMDSEVAAAYLGITVKSLYGQVERGHIKPLRGPRRTYRFTVEMLDDYLRN